MTPRGPSDLREPGRHIAIITTASLPWRTGTAVNPTLRAAYLAHLYPKLKVTLLLPWLAVSDQRRLFPDGLEFATPDAQEAWVRKWVHERAGFDVSFRITWYPGRYDAAFRSIFAVGDVTQYVPDSEADAAILEEPEHLTWFHHGRRMTYMFNHVVGILHTNYIDYIRRGGRGQPGGPAAARLVYAANRKLCSVHCHKVIKLSDAVQHLPRQSTCFMHGVSTMFLAVGDQVAAAANPEPNPKPSSTSAAAAAQASDRLPALGHTSRALAGNGATRDATEVQSGGAPCPAADAAPNAGNGASGDAAQSSALGGGAAAAVSGGSSKVIREHQAGAGVTGNGSGLEPGSERSRECPDDQPGADAVRSDRAGEAASGALPAGSSGNGGAADRESGEDAPAAARSGNGGSHGRASVQGPPAGSGALAGHGAAAVHATSADGPSLKPNPQPTAPGVACSGDGGRVRVGLEAADGQRVRIRLLVEPTSLTEADGSVDRGRASASSGASSAAATEAAGFTKGAYFLGKALWGKGYTELLQLLAAHKAATGDSLRVDAFGSGEDAEEIRRQAKERGLALSMHGGVDHLDARLRPFRAFLNPSTSDVVATTSAEALAMGKWLLCPQHPSNVFFATFANCLIYRSSAEFAAQLRHAESCDPAPLSAKQRQRLTWEAATERLLDAAHIGAGEWPAALARLYDGLTWPLINVAVGIEAVRRVVGAGRYTAMNPGSVLDYDPEAPGPCGRSIDSVVHHLALGYPEPRIL